MSNIAGMSGAAGADDGDDTRKGKKNVFQPEVVVALMQELKENPRPNKQRKLELSGELGLTETQVARWFENRRYRYLRPASQRRNENSEENDYATRHVLHSWGHPAAAAAATAQNQVSMVFRVSSPVEDPDHSVTKVGSNGLVVDVALLAHNSSPSHIRYNTPFQPIDHSELMTRAEKELQRLALDDSMWQSRDRREILNQTSYYKIYPRTNKRRGNFMEASRVSFQVNMEHMKLASMLTNLEEWRGLFPTIVSRAATIEFITPRTSVDDPNGSLQLMYKELQVTSPLIPNQSFIFHRSCKQIDPDTWLIVDASFEPPEDRAYPFSCRRLPSGCLIKGIDGGSSKVTWVEHVELEVSGAMDKFYKDMLENGSAYGAERWAGCLMRSCERILSANEGDEEKRNEMNLSKRMIRSFFNGINAISGKHLWACVFGEEHMKIHFTLRESDSLNQLIVAAATTILLPFEKEVVFTVLTEEMNRAKWDVLWSSKEFTEVSSYKTGVEPGNHISKVWVKDEPDIMLLQESSTDPLGSLSVWSVVEEEAVVGVEYDHVELVPSGFTVGTNGGTESLMTYVTQLIIEKRDLSEEEKTALLKFTKNIVGNTLKKIHEKLMLQKIQRDCLE